MANAKGRRDRWSSLDQPTVSITKPDHSEEISMNLETNSTVEKQSEETE